MVQRKPRRRRPAGPAEAGFTLIARGEFSIVIARIAVAEGVEAEIGPLSVAYVLILAIGGSLAAKAADPLSQRLPPRPNPG